MNILLFGPNGSGKGTQGAVLQKQFSVAHVESGVIFRENISKGTELGKKAKEYIDRGELVPDDITIPMILDRLKEPDCAKGWLLDGFPRNYNQAKQLDEALAKANSRAGLRHRNRPRSRDCQEPDHGAKTLRQRQQPSQQRVHRSNQADPNRKQDRLPGLRRRTQGPVRRPGRGRDRQTAFHLLQREGGDLNGPDGLRSLPILEWIIDERGKGVLAESFELTAPNRRDAV